MTVTGPDFLALQVRDLDRSAHFYETLLGLRRMPASPPGAVVRHHPHLLRPPRTAARCRPGRGDAAARARGGAVAARR